MSSYYLDRPLVMAHRGAKDTAPENTIAAFERAISLGADAVEMDIVRCASGEIVVLHDDTVDRTSNGSGHISSLRLEQLRRLDAGSWFDPAFAGERIPTLQEVLDAIGGRIRLNIEIKRQVVGAQPMEAELAALLRERKLVSDTIVSSFVPGALGRLRRVAPEIPRALLYAPQMPLPLRHAWPRFWLAPQALHPYYGLLDATYVSRAHKAGYRVNVWTVNEAQDMAQLARVGVDALITDHVKLARVVLGLEPA
ncbi:MAG: glycerophosphodiester phosphodiesterase [Anaerolineae bacterium]|jgi:glycerophosphoryl diester phosphodiesterase|nr:glycerophosphodiester phosphodiesterase [Chloroflexota bacterium]